ncbi:hypothetical protein AFUB_065320 [Aspergillus fumigatus A1163]|uniref:Uncharacterized protein n=1 Tax=Aspergillus fumigatus (strain CBS 144.89 / FGSC A1163 / CEA10) TaxID=451804 RepID=B0Y615_ASPFC|nr:hypothetical protein AFUB_065320 [Aspergillus fumigatus A1163]
MCSLLLAQLSSKGSLHTRFVVIQTGCVSLSTIPWIPSLPAENLQLWPRLIRPVVAKFLPPCHPAVKFAGN